MEGLHIYISAEHLAFCSFAQDRGEGKEPLYTPDILIDDLAAFGAASDLISPCPFHLKLIRVVSPSHFPCFILHNSESLMSYSMSLLRIAGIVGVFAPPSPLPLI